MTNLQELEQAKQWIRALPRSQFDLFLALSNDSYKRGEKAGALSKAREADELRAAVERLRGVLAEVLSDDEALMDITWVRRARAALGEKQ